MLVRLWRAGNFFTRLAIRPHRHYYLENMKSTTDYSDSTDIRIQESVLSVPSVVSMGLDQRSFAAANSFAFRTISKNALR